MWRRSALSLVIPSHCCRFSHRLTLHQHWKERLENGKRQGENHRTPTTWPNSGSSPEGHHEVGTVGQGPWRRGDLQRTVIWNVARFNRMRLKQGSLEKPHGSTGKR